MPAVALTTVIAPTLQATVTKETGQAAETQIFLGKQKTKRPGAPPRGPPPTGGRPGAPPKGLPPTGGKKAAKDSTPSGDSSTKAAATPAANIPQAPPVGHFMAFLKGEYDPANPPTDNGDAPGDDLQFKSTDVEGADQLAQADVDDMAGMIDAIGGDEIPEVERSSIVIPDKPVE